jgi:hypothetical protein
MRRDARPPSCLHRVRGSRSPATVIPAQASEDGPPPHHRAEPAGIGTTRFVIAAAGDIACQKRPVRVGLSVNCQYDDTAHLIDGTGSRSRAPAGDNQYEIGAFVAYMNYFDPTWGRAKSTLPQPPATTSTRTTRPSRPRGYFRILRRRGEGTGWARVLLLRRRRVPRRPVLAPDLRLSSELCFASGGCGPAADPSNPGPGNRMYAGSPRTSPTIRTRIPLHPRLLAPSAVLVLHGERPTTEHGGSALAVAARGARRHRAERSSHNYQRWRPMGPNGDLDRETGIREFVVGTGGASHYALRVGRGPTTSSRPRRGVRRVEAHAQGGPVSVAMGVGRRSASVRRRLGHAVRCVRATLGRR